MSSLLTEGDPGPSAEPEPTTDGAPAAAEPTTNGEPEPQRPGWIEQLLPKNRDDADLVKKLSGYERIDDLVRDAIEAGELRSAQGTQVATAEEYELPEVAYPEGFDQDPDTETFFRGLAHELKLSKEVAAQAWEKFNQWTVGRLEEAQNAVNEGRKAAEDRLKDRWGNDFKVNFEVARRFIAKSIAGYAAAVVGEDPTGDKAKAVTSELTDRVDDSGLGNDSVFIEWMHWLAKGFGEDHKEGGDKLPTKDEDLFQQLFPGSRVPKRNEF